MNDLCKELNFSSDLYPNVDISKFDTDKHSWVTFHETLNPHDLNNEYLFEYLKSLGMCSHWIEVFYTPPLQDGVIHSDNTNWLDWTKIYFQYGAEGSTLRWWESDKVMEYRTDTMKDDYHGQVLIAEEEESTLIYEKDLSTPHLVNVGKLHSSHNPTNEKRFVVTLALHDLEGNRILWNDALSKLSKNIL